MTIIKQEDLIQSIADALQFISYYHPRDYIQALGRAYELEQSAAAKDAIAQILYNSRLCAEGHRPICQDTGIVVVFLEVGMDVQWDCELSLDDMVNEGVRRAYLNSDNVLRASVLADPAGSRKNTRDNTPAVIHTKLVEGNTLKVKLAAKGGGSENKAKFAALNPSDNLLDWIIKSVESMGAGWCPPGILGVGIGGTPEKAMLMAKESLLEPVNIQELKLKSEQGHRLNTAEELRLELYDKINALGIGAQGLGGLTTVVDVKVLDYPTHAASLPVAIIPNCAATRHTHFTLDGSGAALLTPPDLADWPDVTWSASPAARHVNLDNITHDDIKSWQPGEQLLLSGKLLTGRDAAHKRIIDTLAKGESLPEGVNFKNRFIYYVGPVDAVNDESVGPAGPTTSTRMDKYTEAMLSQTGLIGMVGKAERGSVAIEAIKKHKAVYLIAVGGAAYLISKAITKSKIIAYEELGMEAIYEFEVKDMPVTVAVDILGESVHQTGPKKWHRLIKQ
ncbi:MAG: fumarate hydratase [gamma proteobacterium symbiont of Taylorina sp.]|nr:fumarate hydratase [gamma proteobacterium symbiont of Taylorina sp.]